MAYPPSRGNSNYGNQRRGSGGHGRFSRGKSQNNWVRDTAESIHQGSLTDYGWRAIAPEEQRHEALEASVASEGFDVTRSRLQLLKNMSGVPEIDRVVQSDLDWMDQSREELER